MPIADVVGGPRLEFEVVIMEQFRHRFQRNLQYVGRHVIRWLYNGSTGKVCSSVSVYA